MRGAGGPFVRRRGAARGALLERLKQSTRNRRRRAQPCGAKRSRRAEQSAPVELSARRAAHGAGGRAGAELSALVLCGELVLLLAAYASRAFRSSAG